MPSCLRGPQSLLNAQCTPPITELRLKGAAEFPTTLLIDACRPAPGVDALMNWRALSEQRELARPPVTCVHLI
jgi:hypothetical protein